jgi:glycosyltransferase involved in cell wall biosynthesis
MWNVSPEPAGEARQGGSWEAFPQQAAAPVQNGSAPLVLSVFPSFAVGGAQVRFTALANRFGSAFRHAVVAMDGNLSAREKLAPGLDVSFLAFAARKGETLGTLRRCRALLRALRPSVLVTSNWGSIEWAIANALPLVRHVHMEDGFGPEERARQIPRRVWTRRVFLRRTTVVLPSRTLRRIAEEEWRLDPRRLRYIPNGVDLTRFVPAQRQEASDAPVIGAVAALRPEKNLGRLLRALQRVRVAIPARLVVVGDGPERAGLQRLACELGIADAVRFVGHVEQPHGVYGSFDVFALSSDTEQMPLSVLEAMACGLPVAATDVGDVRAMLAEANGPFVTPADEAALADALLALLRQPALRRDVGAANRFRAEQSFDEQAMVRAYAALLGGTDEV